ncbi:MAG: Gfo/Idh/MocA family oxidoreductase [FCB group bacterium]|jgi:predicted dehydrogenase|nr:Gfo/Idh/MocA family oxidoreductase [FCB group bacterium]
MLGIGVLGAGNFAAKHLRAVDGLQERARVLKAARRSAEPWSEAEARGIELVAPEALLNSPEIDAVAVCVPNSLHAHYVAAALEAGKHVFCEKPLATRVEDADRLIALSRDCGRVLMVGHLTRHTASYVAVADALQRGVLGPVLAVHMSRLQVRSAGGWRLDPELGGGAVFDLLIHDFDLLGWYLGRPREVVARAIREDGRACRYMLALFDYAGGVSPVAEGGFVLPEGASFQSGLRIVCEKGLLEIDAALPPGVILRIVEEGAQPVMVPAPRYTQSCRGLLGEYEEFLDTIEGRPQGRLRLEDARLAVEMACNAAASAQLGGPVSFG